VKDRFKLKTQVYKTKQKNIRVLTCHSLSVMFRSRCPFIKYVKRHSTNQVKSWVIR